MPNWLIKLVCPCAQVEYLRNSEITISFAIHHHYVCTLHIKIFALRNLPVYIRLLCVCTQAANAAQQCKAALLVTPIVCVQHNLMHPHNDPLFNADVCIHRDKVVPIRISKVTCRARCATDAWRCTCTSMFCNRSLFVARCTLVVMSQYSTPYCSCE